jgi:hypothetical protein
MFEEMANMFGFCSRKGGRHARAGGNGVEMVACVVWGVWGGLFDIILRRRDSKLFQILSPRFWVGCLVE